MRSPFARNTAIAATLILSLTGCEGPTGPEGPAGDRGPTGPGGQDGAANVIYSDWFAPGSYALSTRFGMTVLSHAEPVAALTQSMLDDGLVLVFARLNGYNPAIWPTDEVGQLPLTLEYDIVGVRRTDHWRAALTPGTVEIVFTNETNSWSSLSPFHEFRYVIVPGGVAAAPAFAGGNAMSYDEIVARFGIPEAGASRP